MVPARQWLRKKCHAIVKMWQYIFIILTTSSCVQEKKPNRYLPLPEETATFQLPELPQQQEQQLPKNTTEPVQKEQANIQQNNTLPTPPPSKETPQDQETSALTLLKECQDTSNPVLQIEQCTKLAQTLKEKHDDPKSAQKYFEQACTIIFKNKIIPAEPIACIEAARENPLYIWHACALMHKNSCQTLKIDASSIYQQDTLLIRQCEKQAKTKPELASTCASLKRYLGY